MSTSAAERLLLERDSELARLRELLDEARSGSGRLVLVEGPAGIGKSELLRATRESAEAMRMTALAARAGELERDYPFGVIRQLYERTVRSERQREALLAGAAARAEALLVGGVEPRLAVDSSLQLFHALYWLTANLAELEPVLVVVDDAQWADDPSLEFLAYLTRRLEDLPVLVAVGLRSGEPAPDPQALAALAGDIQAERIRPRALSQEGASALVRTLLFDEADADLCLACHEMSGGNPFLLRELVRELASGGGRPEHVTADQVRGRAPETVLRTVVVRLARLGEQAGALARAVAVLGDGAELRLAAALAGLAAADAARVSDALADADILRAERPLAFVHPLTRTAVYADLAAGRRAELHRDAAALLERERAPAERIGVHLLATDPADDPDSVRILRDAAAGTLSRGRPAAAASYLRRALEEPPPAADRPAVLAELFRAEMLTGDIAALDRFSQLVEEEGAGREAVVDSAPAAMRGMFAAGEHERAVRLVGGAVERLRGSDPEAALRLDAELVAIAARFPATVVLARERLARHATRSGGPATPAERLMVANLAFDQAMRGRDASGTATLALGALDGGRMLADETSDSQPFYAAVEALIVAGEPDAASEPIRDALDEARRRGSAVALALASIEQCLAALVTGDLVDAAGAARTTLAVAREGGWAAAVSNLAGMLAQALVEMGELDAAEHELARAGVGELIALEHRGASRLLGARGALRLARGDVERGASDLRLAARAVEVAGYEFDHECWASLAAAATGSPDDDVERDLRRAEEFGAPRSIGIAFRAKALAVRGDDELPLLARSVEVLGDSPARLEHARSLVELGAALRRRRRRKEAREALHPGLRLADAINARLVAARAREELAASGERVPERRLTSADALTPSERRIAEMAASGMANKEIAQALFLTRKTIEFHLSNAYRKLDISSRAQLPEALR